MHCTIKIFSLEIIQNAYSRNSQVIPNNNTEDYVALTFSKLSNHHLAARFYLIYCYNSVIQSLEEMMNRSNFLEMCNGWQRTTDGIYKDVYDGKIWENFMEHNDEPFLSAPNNLVLMLNVDWFQPFDHTNHSEGVIYLAIMNLPRKVRFLQHNIILVGTIKKLR